MPFVETLRAPCGCALTAEHRVACVSLSSSDELPRPWHIILAPRSPTEETRQRGGAVLRCKSSKETGENFVNLPQSAFCDRLEVAGGYRI